MLQLTVPGGEYFDETDSSFVYVKEQKLQLKHSLVSISKWEATWGRAFLSTEPKTQSETMDYIRCMTITQNVNPLTYLQITSAQIGEIADYINHPMSATVFSVESNSSGKTTTPSRQDVVTSELLYYYMTALNIPFECQKWHLNRLLTFIKVCSVKTAPKEKMSKGDLLRRNREINKERQAKLNTKG